MKRDKPAMHKCSSIKVGDEIIFTCLLCPKYERRMNVIDGTTTVKGDNQEILHKGFHSIDPNYIFNPN